MYHIMKQVVKLWGKQRLIIVFSEISFPFVILVRKKDF